MPHHLRSERHRRKRNHIRFARIARYANPKYHWRKLLEDIKSAKAGLKMWQLDNAKSEAELRGAIRGKLFATFLAGTPIAGIGSPAGYAIQIWSNDPMLGVVCGVLLANVLGLIAFQIIWGSTNRAFYEKRYGGWSHRWAALFHDLWPMQWKSIRIALFMNIFLLPLAWVVTALLHLAFPNGLRFIPIGFLLSAAEAVFIQTTTLRLLGDLFERHSRVLARQYSPSLDSCPVPEEC